ncbi:MAG TPA: hypothetical protein VN886_15405 [Acidimicrobiales bacterium]|nr:hypothetical protein [Acidimicrobiales bacterium]
MVIASRRIWLMTGIELAQHCLERTVIPLAHHLDTVSDQEGGADPLPRLIMTFRAKAVIDDLGSTGGADIHEERQSNVVLLRHRQHGVSRIEHLLGPVLAGFALDSGSSVQYVEPVTSTDVRRLSRSAESEFLGAEHHDVDMGMVEQTFRM